MRTTQLFALHVFSVLVFVGCPKPGPHPYNPEPDADAMPVPAPSSIDAARDEDDASTIVKAACINLRMLHCAEGGRQLMGDSCEVVLQRVVDNPGLSPLDPICIRNATTVDELRARCPGVRCKQQP